MRFKDYIQLNEWIHNNPKQLTATEKEFSEIKTTLKTDKFKTEQKLELLYNKLYSHYQRTLKLYEETKDDNALKELKLLKPIINELYDINKTHFDIRTKTTQVVLPKE
jgi:hypothetical protein